MKTRRIFSIAIIQLLLISGGMAQENNANLLQCLNEISLHKNIKNYFSQKFPLPDESQHHVVFYAELGKFEGCVTSAYKNNFALLVKPDDLIFFNLSEYFSLDTIIASAFEYEILFSSHSQNKPAEFFKAKLVTDKNHSWRLKKLRVSSLK